MERLSIKELSNKLSISEATAKNWLRLGKISPQFSDDGKPFFSQKYVNDLLKKLHDKNNSILKSRRNKNCIKGKFFYKDYVSDTSVNIKTIEKLLETPDIIQEENFVKYLAADCAIQLIIQSKKLQTGICRNFLLNYLENNIDLGVYSPLVDFFIESKKNALSFIKKYPHLFDSRFVYEKNEDILGLLYISCSSMGKRKQCGMYYTPTKVVKTAIKNIFLQNKITPEDKFLDCCCGTGNFLLNLPDSVRPEQIYGNDIDTVSCHITKINLALKYDAADLETINANITNSDFLFSGRLHDFSYIIGNPPWGYCYTPEQKQNLSKLYKTAGKENVESFDLFIEKSLASLKKNGVLSFVLPESVLHVQSHKEIREIIKKENSIQYLHYLGNIFDGVNCPGIILQVVHTGEPLKTAGMVVDTGTKVYKMNSDREVDIKNFSFKMSNEEYELLKKLLKKENKKYLKNNAEFALGIVTGNNKEYLHSVKNETNEVIIKGCDIEPYKIKEGKSFIVCDRAKFQQCAPLEKYRTPEKLVYKFISSRPVFAYDNAGRLTLNSCNILIPHIKGMDIKYILAVLNSSVAGFIYRKNFNSVKVLKSHLENIPIPVCDEKAQKEITCLVDKIIAAKDIETYKNLYNTVDDKIRMLYGADSDEYRLILAVSG